KLVIVRRDAVAQQPAAPQRRNHKALHRAESARYGLQKLLLLGVGAPQQLAGVDADFRPDAQDGGDQALLVAVIDQRTRRFEGEVLELGKLGGAQTGHAALDVLDAVGVV